MRSSPHKSNYIERFIRTIKKRIFTYMYDNNTKKWYDVLEDITESLNNSYHRTIKTTPNSVNSDNAEEIWYKTFLPFPKPKKEKIKKNKKKRNKQFKYKIGQSVRIVRYRHKFSRSFKSQYTGEIFTISSRYWRNENTAAYQITDLLGNKIQGTFVSGELQPVYYGPDIVYRISEIKKKIKLKGKKGYKYLVGWEDWSPAFDSFIYSKDIINIGEEVKK